MRYFHIIRFSNFLLFPDPLFPLAMFVPKTRKKEETGARARARRQCLIRKFFSLKFSRIMGIIHPRGKVRLNPYETRWQTGIKRPKYSGAAVTRAGMKF